MALRYTVQYADPRGPHPLAHDAAWQTFSSTDHADMALADAQQAAQRGNEHKAAALARLYPPYAVRILDGSDVIVTDVPGSMPDDGTRELIGQVRELADLGDDTVDDPMSTLENLAMLVLVLFDRQAVSR